VCWRDSLKIKGWDGNPDQQGGAVFEEQATFHPTKYLSGLLRWLGRNDNFQCYTQTRVLSIEEKGSVPVINIGNKHVKVSTQDGNVIKSKYAVEATCVPLQKLSLIAEMEYDRTYCIAARIPKDIVEDCLLYDTAEEYKYIRLTECDEKDDYMIVGGCDHKVGQESPEGRFEELERWTRERFTKLGSVDFKWSGQVFEPVRVLACKNIPQTVNDLRLITWRLLARIKVMTISMSSLETPVTD
jgi:glycine/D-amino acid oxidase-like deaminating enzyme